MGCDEPMDVPDLYARVKAMPAATPGRQPALRDGPHALQRGDGARGGLHGGRHGNGGLRRPRHLPGRRRQLHPCRRHQRRPRAVHYFPSTPRTSTTRPCPACRRRACRIVDLVTWLDALYLGGGMTRASLAAHAKCATTTWRPARQRRSLRPRIIFFNCPTRRALSPPPTSLSSLAAVCPPAYSSLLVRKSSSSSASSGPS